MLCSYIGVPQLASSIAVQHSLCFGGKTGRVDVSFIARSYNILDCLGYFPQIKAIHQNACRYAVVFLYQSEKNMLGADIVMIQTLRLILCKGESPATLSENLSNRLAISIS